jgi:hypothetical protein
MEEFPMKILLATVALATLLTSSAYAQYGVARGYYRAYAHFPPYAAYRSYGFNRAYAQVPLSRYAPYRPYPPYRDYGSYGSSGSYAYRSGYPYSVYDIRGWYLGSDPDPRVRSMLARDPGYE